MVLHLRVNLIKFGCLNWNIRYFRLGRPIQHTAINGNSQLIFARAVRISAAPQLWQNYKTVNFFLSAKILLYFLAYNERDVMRLNGTYHSLNKINVSIYKSFSSGMVRVILSAFFQNSEWSTLFGIVEWGMCFMAKYSWTKAYSSYLIAYMNYECTIAMHDIFWSLMHIDGPFGSPMEEVLCRRIVVCVAGGMGITPFAAILEHIRYILML